MRNGGLYSFKSQCVGSLPDSHNGTSLVDEGLKVNENSAHNPRCKTATA